MKDNNLLIVISGPSGTGKGTVIKALRQKIKNVILLPSVTTRDPRKGEIEGHSYFFNTKEEFNKMIEKDEFVEWVEYCDNYYGTPRKQLNTSLESGVDIVLEKEVKGAVEIKKQYPKSVLIFLLPP
jgi:guanylate kinase